MQEKLGEVNISLTRTRVQTPGAGKSQSLKTGIVFDIAPVVRYAKTNIGPRVAVMFGLGKKLGYVRLYFNRQAGPKLSQYSGSHRIVQFSVAETSEPLNAFFKAHKVDVKQVMLTAALYRAGINTYLEFMIPPATFNDVTFPLAVNELPEVSGLEGWREYSTLNLERRRASAANSIQKKTGTKPPVVHAAAAPSHTATSKPSTFGVEFDKDYLILKQDDGQLWIRKATVNIDVFRVVNNHPVVKLSDGSEVTLPTTPQELLRAYSGE